MNKHMQVKNYLKEIKSDDKNKEYKMRQFYDPKNLCISKFEYITYDIKEKSPKIKQTEQKYIFEKIIKEDEIFYREIFTGYITSEMDRRASLDVPYISDVEDFSLYYNEDMNENINKYKMILLLDEINRNKKENNKTF